MRSPTATRLQALAQAEGGNFKIAPWDWRYYAEKLRKKLHDVDEASIKQYLQLDNIIEAAFDTATRLFGLHFKEVNGITAWHPDVRAWDVTDAAGKHVALFFGDYFARPSKHSGAWMTSLRDQEKLNGDNIRPLIVNVMNFNKGADGNPALLSYDDARTLFHEFGHALHGILSDVTYPMIAGTNVDTDFVELPSQLYEHWFERPEVLRKFAVHYQDRRADPGGSAAQGAGCAHLQSGLRHGGICVVGAGRPGIPLAEIGRRARRLDIRARDPRQARHARGDRDAAPLAAFPACVLGQSSYSAAYYSYMWSEVLDADAFRAFEEAGDIFDPATAGKLRDNIYAAGGRRGSDESYIAFRGQSAERGCVARATWARGRGSGRGGVGERTRLNMRVTIREM